MTANPGNVNDTARVLEEAGVWKTVIDSGEMSEEQRLEFHAWLDEPRNGRALTEIRAIVALIQELPENNKATSLRTIRMPPHSIEADRRGIWTRPLAAITVAAAAVSVGSGSFGLSATLANSVGDWFWSGSSPSTTMHPVAAFVVSCGAGLAGSVWAALFFRRAMSK
jgi:ferric-dicitrate binding protein FerR (iron transport regulator)